MPIVVDTNVLVRLFVGDNPVQHRAVMRRLEGILAAGDSAFVPPVVLAELAWVLESTYGFGTADIARAIEATLTTPPLVVDEEPTVRGALKAFVSGTAGFADCLILSGARARNATMLTFDRKLLRERDTERP